MIFKVPSNPNHSMIMKISTTPTTKVMVAGTITWMCAGNDVQIFNSTGKASSDTSKCLQSILLK